MMISTICFELFYNLFVSVYRIRHSLTPEVKLIMTNPSRSVRGLILLQNSWELILCFVYKGNNLILQFILS